MALCGVVTGALPRRRAHQKVCEDVSGPRRASSLAGSRALCWQYVEDRPRGPRSPPATLTPRSWGARPATLSLQRGESHRGPRQNTRRRGPNTNPHPLHHPPHPTSGDGALTSRQQARCSFAATGHRGATRRLAPRTRGQSSLAVVRWDVAGRLPPLLAAPPRTWVAEHGGVVRESGLATNLETVRATRVPQRLRWSHRLFHVCLFWRMDRNKTKHSVVEDK